MEYFNVVSDSPACEYADKWTKILLKNQFHDILPGTCITPVYEKYNVEMDELISELNNKADEYAALLTAEDADSVTLYNTLSFVRNDVAVIENENRFAADVPSQQYTDVCGRKSLAIDAGAIEGFNAKTIKMTDKAPDAASVFKYDGEKLETPFAVITTTTPIWCIVRLQGLTVTPRELF